VPYNPRMPRKIKPPPEKPKAAPARRPVGRPSGYRPEYCERVIELGKDGASPAQMAADLGITHRNTLDDWAEVHPEFSEAYTHARTQAQAWWERTGMAGLNADRFNGLVWKTSMQARFRDDYTEKRIQEHTGKDGGPIQTEAKILDASALSPEERDAVRAVLLMAKGKT